MDFSLTKRVPGKRLISYIFSRQGLILGCTRRNIKYKSLHMSLVAHQARAYSVA